MSIYPLDLKNDPADLLAFQLPEEKSASSSLCRTTPPKMYLFANEKIEPLTSESFRALAQPLDAFTISASVLPATARS